MRLRTSVGPLSLTSITFVNCANPFKKDGKTLFKSRDFATLDIDYS